MTDTDIENSNAETIDKIVAGGWDEVIDRVRMTSERLIEIAANINAHRKPAMTIAERRDSGLLDLRVGLLVDDLFNLIRGFRPPKRSTVQIEQPEFTSPFDSVRKEFPSGELLCRHIEAIDLSFFATVDAVEILAERPGMPIPTFEQLVSIFIELVRLKSILTVVETAASEDLSSGSSADIDLFGVGASAAKIVNQIIPPRCVPGEGRVTLPRQPSIDDVIAGYLLETFVLSKSPIYFERQANESFHAADTHATNHATVGVGSEPFHAPKQLCFDRRALKQPITNTELVIAHAIEMGTPLDFTDPMERLAAGDRLGEFQFEADMINTFFEVCRSTSLAMGATRLLMKNQFKASDAFMAWREKRSMKYLTSLPEYQKHAPRVPRDTDTKA